MRIFHVNYATSEGDGGGVVHILTWDRAFEPLIQIAQDYKNIEYNNTPDETIHVSSKSRILFTFRNKYTWATRLEKLTLVARETRSSLSV